MRPERREHFQDRGGDAAAAQDAHAGLEQGVGPFGQAVPGRRPRVAADATEPGERQCESHLGALIRVDALGRGPRPTVVEQVQERLGAGPRELYPPQMVTVPGEQCGQVLRRTCGAPQESLGLLDGHDLGSSGAQGVDHPREDLAGVGRFDGDAWSGGGWHRHI